MSYENIDLETVKKELDAAREVAQRMSEICLFLDTNYCQKALKEPMLQRLNTIIFKTLSKNIQVLQVPSTSVFDNHKNKDPKLHEILTLID